MVEYYCNRCGRKCSSNPQFVGDRVYGSVCVTKISAPMKTGNLSDGRIW